MSHGNFLAKLPAGFWHVDHTWGIFLCCHKGYEVFMCTLDNVCFHQFINEENDIMGFELRANHIDPKGKNTCNEWN